jgi:hypothetical protein
MKGGNEMEYTFEIQVTNCAACVVNNYDPYEKK